MTKMNASNTKEPQMLFPKSISKAFSQVFLRVYGPLSMIFFSNFSCWEIAYQPKRDLTLNDNKVLELVQIFSKLV
jgi:hypothetical protein